MIVIGRTKEIMNDSNYPSIYDLVSDNEIQNKSYIVNYLKSGRVSSASPSIVYDIISGEKINQHLEMLNDGKYAWRSDTIYYFEKYNMKLSDEFIDHVLSRCN